jgi:DNA-directed RNA polymerase specialized sigma24 family protein
VARQELNRRLRLANEQADRIKPLRKRTRVAEESEEDQRFPEVVERSFESKGIDTEDWLPDDHSPGPDVVAAGHDLLNHLQVLAAGWPHPEREVFELYFVEGFDEDEISLMEKLTSAQVRGVLEKLQIRMRESFVEVARAVAPAAGKVSGKAVRSRGSN